MPHAVPMQNLRLGIDLLEPSVVDAELMAFVAPTFIGVCALK